MNAVSIYMTFPDKDAAKSLTQILLEKRLIACANLFVGVSSLYRWEGAFQEDEEVVVIAKTTGDKKDAIQKLVEKQHPYEVPCLLFTEISDGFMPYLKWLQAQVGEP